MAPSHATSSEAALLARLRAGEAAARAELVRAHGGRLLQLARLILGQGEETEASEAVREAFLETFAGLGEYTGQPSFGAWLARRAARCALQRQRWGGEPEPFLGDLLPRFLEDGHHVDHPPAWGDGPGDLRPPDEMAGTVREEVAALPRIFRIAVALCDIEGMETPEAARLLGLTEPALRTRLHRARQALRARLEGRLRRADT